VSGQARAIAAVCVCALHLALLAPTVGSWSSILERDFGPEAEAIEDGDRPYDDQELEYPPLSIPLIVGPALPGEGNDQYIEAFQWEMIGFDLAIVLVLALALPGSQRRVLGALGVYTAGIVALSGIVLADSIIDEAPLALARFDLVPALLVLAAVLARERGRSASWSALLATGAAVKAFPLLLYPALLRGERHPGRVAVGVVIPLAVAVAIVVAWGDHFTSAITHQSDRALQVETIAATPFAVSNMLGAEVHTEFTNGSWNVVATGADAARAVSLVATGCGYLLVLWAGWRRKVAWLPWATALLTVIVVLYPVLSPQFLLWLLPLSAAAYGLGRENLVLLAALVLTELALRHYDDAIGDLHADFVWRLAGRNLLLLVYLWLVCAPIVRPALAGALPAKPHRTIADPRAP
jgi:Glycosyltransferase family 87